MKKFSSSQLFSVVVCLLLFWCSAFTRPVEAQQRQNAVLTQDKTLFLPVGHVIISLKDMGNEHAGLSINEETGVITVQGQQQSLAFTIGELAWSQEGDSYEMKNTKVAPFVRGGVIYFYADALLPILGLQTDYEKGDNTCVLWPLGGSNSVMESRSRITLRVDVLSEAAELVITGGLPQGLKEGNSGADVIKWQKFLNHVGKKVVVNGKFDSATVTATQEWQMHWNRLRPAGRDETEFNELGIVDANTMSWAMVLGYNLANTKKPNPEKNSPPHIAGQPLRASVATLGNTRLDPKASWSREWNKGFSHLKVTKETAKGLVHVRVYFEENKGTASYTHGYGFLIRLFDANGRYLTAIKTKPLKLKWTDYSYIGYKTLTYKVNVRDLRDAKIAEFGFSPYK